MFISIVIVKDQLEALPELITRCLTQHQERVDQRRNFLHPDTAATTMLAAPNIPPSLGSPLLIPHSRCVLNTRTINDIKFWLRIFWNITFCWVVLLVFHVFLSFVSFLLVFNNDMIRVQSMNMNARKVPSDARFLLLFFCHVSTSSWWPKENGFWSIRWTTHPYDVYLCIILSGSVVFVYERDLVMEKMYCI